MAGFDATLVAALGFGTFVGTMIWLKVPGQITKALDERSGKIAGELAEARRLREEADALLEQSRQTLESAEADAAALLARAEADAEALKVRAARELDAATARRTREAEERIQRAEAQAVADVRAAATETAVRVAERVLAGSVEGKAADQLVAAGIDRIPGKFG